MPITVIDKKYVSYTGEVQNFLFANAGDSTLVRYTLMERFEVIQSSTNQLFIGLFDDTITWPSGNWLKEGFLVGDVVVVKKYDSGGNLMVTDGGTIIAITGSTNNVMQLSNGNLLATIVPNLGNGEFLVVTMATDYRAMDLKIAVNYVSSQSTGNEYSLIDGEPTIFTFNIGAVAGFPYIPNGTILNGTQVGANKSGTFSTTAKLIFSSALPASYGFPPGYGVTYELQILSTNNGPLLEPYFALQDQLKLNVKIEYARVYLQPFNRNFFYVSDDAQTGFFNEAYNTAVPQTTLIGTTGQYFLDVGTGISAVFSKLAPATLPCGVGGMYVPSDESYYKNQPFNQSQLCCMRSTTLANSTIQSSTVMPDGSSFSIIGQIVFQTATSIQVVNYIVFNAAFQFFMSQRAVGDRRFIAWVNAGNVNHIIFDGQLELSPPVPQPLLMLSNTFLDHSQNITSIGGINFGYQANKEDDLAFTGSFHLTTGETYSGATAKIVARNVAETEEFTLMQCNFNFASVPFVNGRYMFPIALPIITTLPNTSVKETAMLNFKPIYDTTTEYGVEIYFPFLLRWEYWIAQLQANVAFFPTQNADWLQYGTDPNWKLEFKFSVIQENTSFDFYDEITIKPYDSSPNIVQTIQLYTYPSMTPITQILNNEVILVVASHTRLDSTPWGSDAWGMITCEPKESAPRSIISTILPHDMDATNPLKNIGGVSLMPINLIAPNIAEMQCLFDGSLINTSNGVKFTTKIKDC
jgi:hypothetical protein